MGAWKQTSSLKHLRRQLVPTKNALIPSRSLANTAQYSDLRVMQLEQKVETNDEK